MVDSSRPTTFQLLKKRQFNQHKSGYHELERDRENEILLQKLDSIGNTRGFYSFRPPLVTPKRSLNHTSRKNELIRITKENLAIKERIESQKSFMNRKKLKQERKVAEKRLQTISAFPYILNSSGKKQQSVNGSSYAESSRKPRLLDPLKQPEKVVSDISITIGDHILIVDITTIGDQIWIKVKNDAETFYIQMKINEAQKLIECDDFSKLVNLIGMDDQGLFLSKNNAPNSLDIRFAEENNQPNKMFSRKSSPRKQATQRSNTQQSTRMPRTKQLLLLNWLNSLQAVERVTERDFPEQCRTGVFLAKIIQNLDPNIKFKGFYRKPIARTACITNIEQIINVLKSRTQKLRVIPSADEVYRGKPDKCWNLIAVVYDAFIFNPLKPRIREILNWYQKTLTMYGRRLQPSTLSAPHTSLVQDFSNGVSLCCILNNFGEKTLSLNKIYWQPENEKELRSNITQMMQYFTLNRIPTIFTVEDFIRNLSVEFLAYQLFIINHVFQETKRRQINGKDILFKDDQRLKNTAPELSPIVSSSSIFTLDSPSLSYSMSSHLNDSRDQRNILPQGSFSSFYKSPKSQEVSRDPSPDKSYQEIEELQQILNVQESPKAPYQKEREQMWISDLRTQTEQRVLQPQLSLSQLRFKSSTPPLKLVQNSKSPRLWTSQEEILCFMLSPRVLKLQEKNNALIPYICSLVPNEQTYSLKNENYNFEWRDLEQMEIQGQIDLNQLANVKIRQPKGIEFQIKAQNSLLADYFIECADSEEAFQYFKGFSHILNNTLKNCT